MRVSLITSAAASTLMIAAVLGSPVSPAHAQGTAAQAPNAGQAVPDGFGHMVLPNTGTVAPGAPSEGTAAKKGDNAANAQPTGHGEGPEPATAQGAGHGEGPEPKTSN